MGQSKPNMIYTLSGQHKIGLCGGYEIKGIDTVFSEFCIYECGSDTVVGEWGAVIECKVEMSDDTLIVSELYLLPIGKNFEIISLPFYRHKYFYVEEKLVEHLFYDNNIRKFSKKEIEQAIGKYKKLSKGNFEYTIHVALMLFWSYVSGDKKAELYFNKIEKKYGPFDGYISEWWSEVDITYKHWKELNDKNNK